jgi:hypothetical protein
MSAHERAATKVCSECGVIKPETDFYTTRKTRKCKACELAASKRRYEGSKDKVLRRCAEYRQVNKSKIADYMARRYTETRDVWLARCKAYRENPEVLARERARQADRYAANREMIQAARKAYYATNADARDRLDVYCKTYYKNNRAKFVARCAKRRAAKAHATPEWADLKAIAKVYRVAAAKPGHVVDHIVPLRGRNVCGLHVEWNLQVITAKANRQKFNKHDG